MIPTKFDVLYPNAWLQYRGSFTVEEDLILGHPEIVCEQLYKNQIIIVHAINCMWNQTMKYHGVSKKTFAKVEEGNETPEYRIILDKRTGDWKFDFWSPTSPVLRS